MGEPNKNELSEAFGLSLTEPVTKSIESLGEVGLDMILNEGILKDIPFLSTAVSVYKIGNTIRERQHVKKLLSFLKEVSSGIADEDERKRHYDALVTDKKKFSQEIEYVLLVIDRYINEAKAVMLGRVYLSYLRGKINWNIFMLYAEMIDRLLPGDYRTLLRTRTTYVPESHYDERYLRLVALGLMGERLVFQGNLGNLSSATQFRRTRDGNELVDIIGEI